MQANRLSDIVFASIIILTPLAIVPARFETYDTTPKLVILFFGLAFLLWFQSGWRSGVQALWRTKVGRKFYLLLAFGVLSLIVSTAFSGDVGLAFAGTVWRRLGALNQLLAFGIAAALGGYVYLRRAKEKLLLLSMETAGAVTSVYALLQYAGWDPFIPSKMYTDKLGAIRPPATLTQATYFATFLLATILVSAGLRIRETSTRWKRWHEGVLIISISALILTGTRSALAGLVAGICLLVFFEREVIARRKALLGSGLVLLALFAVGVPFFVSPASKGFRARLAQWTVDSAGGPRLLVWRDSLPIVWHNAALGVGPELFEPEFRRAESLDLARAYPDSYFESPHNLLLEFAVGQGLPGLAVWIAVVLLGCYCGVKALRRTAPLFAALVAMLISLQFCPLTLTNELYLLTLIALLVASAAPDTASESRTCKLPPSLVVCFRAGAVVLVLLASAYTLQAIGYSITELRVYRGDLTSAENWYATTQDFPMPGPNLSVSRVCASQANRFPARMRARAFGLAILAAEVAERSSAEEFNALYQSGTLAIIKHDLPLAETKLRAAIEAAPNWYRARMALACVLWWQGRGQEAQLETDRAIKCAGVLEASVRRTTDMARAQVSASSAR